ncbi:uncharacterized protein LOC122795969 [Protopterus annectens]|uniref:uncharacterized protein LOC122795969 n=1 Tax=Protopterus annectens TaxID=7888 RepID=UPI001CFAAD2C|nr:uncharacterized protein LOC122795969 [Protopterus annectens]
MIKWNTGEMEELFKQNTEMNECIINDLLFTVNSEKEKYFNMRKSMDEKCTIIINRKKRKIERDLLEYKENRSYPLPKANRKTTNNEWNKLEHKTSEQEYVRDSEGRQNLQGQNGNYVYRNDPLEFPPLRRSKRIKNRNQAQFNPMYARESLSEMNSDSIKEELIKSSKHDISVLSEKEPPSTSKRKSPEGQESHDGSERIYNGIHARDSKEPEDSLSEINSKPDEEESIKCSKQYISVLYEKGLPPASKRKSLECNDSHDGSRRIHIQTHARDNREEVSSEKRPEDELDMSSSLVSGAASSVKHKMDVRLTTPKKKNHLMPVKRKIG